ncbi:MAG: CehA/McbA family metallohydrolase [Chthonomonadales bacterium]|nr:CehA/McbA family metallohydrolase [Chthonomonadales bacterium]
MNPSVDGPASPLFTPVPLPIGSPPPQLDLSMASEQMRNSASAAPSGDCVCWGIPFDASRSVVVHNTPVELKWSPTIAPWLVVMHTSDVRPADRRPDGLYPHPTSPTRLREHAADYVFVYADGREERVPILRQHQIGMLQRGWGQCCFEAVTHRKPFTIQPLTDNPRSGVAWGWSQTRAANPDGGPWMNWLWAWKNPRPETPIVGLRIEPKEAFIVLSGITAGRCTHTPLRWNTRRKALLQLGEGEAFDPNLTMDGRSKHLELDLGQIISIVPRTVYPNERWAQSYNNIPPEVRLSEVIIEYTAHPDALFHLPDGGTVPAGALREASLPSPARLTPIAPATQRVRLKVIEKGSGKPVPVKLHVHGEAGEYLAPVDRHRYPNVHWYEDWSVDYINPIAHNCTYIPGETTLDLPLGRVYLEVSKGFEIAPVRKAVHVGKATREITLTIERVLHWREHGWVTADTHVHFLSPTSAHLEGSAEGVNVVNLLASQLGELMTNVGDFDGKNTYGAKDCGGDGEYLVRVGTENRQHVLGHISLLGYNGPIIAPMTVGGPDESALGDPVDILLTEWARQCRKQGGIVVVPHFPFPRAENAAAIISGAVDAVEMTSWSNLYAGIDPYSISDWYRYLNNGYFVAAVGGTDKMSATTAVGAVRTYAKLPEGRPFTYDTWKEAIRAGNTFATYGPLLEFSVEGKPPGTRMKLGRAGGTVGVHWQAASVTVPMTRVQLVVNGEIVQDARVKAREGAGSWSVKVDRSSWIALLVRGRYPDRPEMIAAHSSPVMVEVEGKPFFAAADALTILHQIEGSLAYLDTIGTRAEDAVYKRVRLTLTSAFRELHNRMHRAGVMHDHTHATDHPEHH